MRTILKKARKKNKLAVCKIAEMLGISKSFYYKIESGARNPSILLAKKIADIFNMKVDEIFFDENMDKTSKKDISA
ncbi:helix-turn-helix transcriptional regulator [Crassaminicella profunda]|uniref:helix-turn-helix transcriptional regulator n=1 Tax=Crassaminicella profunda TaxID=1286698 RepID=UPI001CA78907|nr:helix-turn-helix transcriptional regulator [Crassaminicella profunda]QZY56676.1 helix-turn-helix transcriptional regulator [Crassaminicella profunda]